MDNEGLASMTAGVDLLSGFSWYSLSNSDSRELVAELFGVRNQLEAVWLQALADLDSRPDAVAGAPDGRVAATFLRQRCYRAPARAIADVRAALLGAKLPKTVAEFAAGRISREHVDVLAGALHTLPNRVQTPERLTKLDDWAASTMPRHAPDLAKNLVRHVLEVLDPDGSERFNPNDFERRGLTFSRDATGMVSITGLADAASAASFESAFEWLSAPQPPREEIAEDGSVTLITDPRTPAQRRLDALVEMCEMLRAIDENCPPAADLGPKAEDGAREEGDVSAAGSGPDAATADPTTTDVPTRADADAPTIGGPPHQGPADAPVDTGASPEMADVVAGPVGTGCHGSTEVEVQASQTASWPETPEATMKAGASVGNDPTLESDASPESGTTSEPGTTPRPDATPGQGTTPEPGSTPGHHHSHLPQPRQTRPAGSLAGARGLARVVIYTDLEQLAAAMTGQPRAGLADTDRIGPLTGGQVQRLACDAILQRVTLDPDSGAVLNLGRTVRTISQAQRRALHARDRGCVIPGCRKPSRYCDGHHITFWRHGGATDLDNLALLCAQHHTEVHTGRWDLVMRNGQPWARPPAWLDPLRRLIRNTYWDDVRAAGRLARQLRLDLDPPPFGGTDQERPAA